MVAYVSVSIAEFLNSLGESVCDKNTTGRFDCEKGGSYRIFQCIGFNYERDIVSNRSKANFAVSPFISSKSEMALDFDNSGTVFVQIS